MQTPCNKHSIEYDHYLYVQLESGKVFCLPENYEVKDSSIDDIKFCVSPTFTVEDLRKYLFLFSNI